MFCVSVSRFALLGASVTLAACAVGEDYVKPGINAAPAWNALAGAAASKDDETGSLPETKPAQGAWWDRFSDPVLSACLEKAATQNNDLHVAEARLIEARASERAAASGLFPQIGSSASSANGSASASTPTHGYGVNGSWDLDLFGGNRRRSEAAASNSEASAADLQRTKLILIAETARQYIQLRSVQQQIALTNRNLAFQRGSLRVTHGQRKEGAISDLEVARAQAQVLSTKARLPALEAAQSAALNRIAILTGAQTADIDTRLSRQADIPQMVSQLALATPIDVLRQRPDVTAAERRYAEASAMTGAARAARFPKLSLEGFFSSGTQVAGVNPWSMAAGAALPLLDFGRLQAQSDAADARQQQALFAYKQSILDALGETESAISAYFAEQKRFAALTAAARQQAQAAMIAGAQYKAGIATQLDALSAAQNQLDAENAAALSKAQIAFNLVILHTALGGF